MSDTAYFPQYEDVITEISRQLYRLEEVAATLLGPGKQEVSGGAADGGPAADRVVTALRDLNRRSIVLAEAFERLVGAAVPQPLPSTRGSADTNLRR